MTYGERLGGAVKSETAAAKKRGSRPVRVWAYAGLTAALMSCGGDPQSDEPLAATQQEWTQCGQTQAFTATVTTPVNHTLSTPALYGLMLSHRSLDSDECG